jgi:hypothetical protein
MGDYLHSPSVATPDAIRWSPGTGATVFGDRIDQCRGTELLFCTLRTEAAMAPLTRQNGGYRTSTVLDDGNGE